MDTKKASLIYSQNNIICAGDPILDIWPDNVERPGGAWNVFDNIKHFTTNVIPVFPPEKWLSYPFNFEQNITQEKVYNCYEPLTFSLKAPTVVLSDYNKGFLSRSKVTIETDLLLVDSKYATIQAPLLQDSKLKILKISNLDLRTPSFISKFDYTIVTHESYETLIYHGPFLLFKVPTPRVVETCSVGAGDVFLAVLSFYLHSFSDSNIHESLYHAVLEAGHHASLTVTQPYTCNLNFLKDINVYN
jgi:hypothetical protein